MMEVVYVDDGDRMPIFVLLALELNEARFKFTCLPANLQHQKKKT
jgi:hypothetical protein